MAVRILNALVSPIAGHIEVRTPVTELMSVFCINRFSHSGTSVQYRARIAPKKMQSVPAMRATGAKTTPAAILNALTV